MKLKRKAEKALKKFTIVGGIEDAFNRTAVETAFIQGFKKGYKEGCSDTMPSLREQIDMLER